MAVVPSAAPVPSAEAWAGSLARALNADDWLALRALLHLDDDLQLAERSRAQLREDWLQAVGDYAPEPRAELLGYCTKERRRLPMSIGGRETVVEFEERVTLVLRGSDSQCFSLRIDDVMRHPAFGWVGVTGSIDRESRACPVEGEGLGPHCGTGSDLRDHAVATPARVPGPVPPASAGEWLVRLVRSY